MADSAMMVESRTVGLVDATRLESWLTDHLEGEPPIELDRIGTDTGVGNAMSARNSKRFAPRLKVRANDMRASLSTRWPMSPR